ncbi:MAG: HAD-IIB family hydrolase [Polyangiaceae bacterium]|nr:HAD-IIB family hydrolase [Polyangiaceae bacterium]
MLPLDRLGSEEARAIDTFAFDLDDTLLDHGRLGLEAYGALFELRRSGLDLVAITGRPSGFAEVIARQWPVTAAVAENGAVAWMRDAGGRVQVIDAMSTELRAQRRAELLAIANRVLERFTELAFADDNWARRTDVALDIGEHRKVDPTIVDEARAFAESLGARTFASSVHTHLTFELGDKATGFDAAVRALGRDPQGAFARAAFAGDSGNDAAAFAAFGLTFGVSNIEAHVAKLPKLPRYVASLPMGKGFAEIAARIVALRS